MEKERVAIDSTQDPNPGKGSQSPSDKEMEFEVEEVMDFDVDLYFRVVQKGGHFEWFAIRADDKSGADYKELEPVFPSPQPAHQTFYSFSGVVGSTIYVLGGVDPSIPLDYYSYCGFPVHKDVNYIDTKNPTGGWKKGESMLKPRGYAKTVTVDSKMYVFGNIFRGRNAADGDEYSVGEVFDTSSSTWRPLSCDMLSSLMVYGLAVLDDNKKKMILLDRCDDRNLYSYDIGSDSWDIYSKSCLGPRGLRSLALVDGVLYYVDHFTSGVMFALDLDDISNPENKLQKVTGLEEYLLAPELDGARQQLFSLGNSMLAMVWESWDPCNDDDWDPCNDDECDPEKIAINYSKLKMSKQRDDHTGQVTFRAQVLSRSCYLVKGYRMYDCVSVKRKAPTASVRTRKRKLEVASTSEAEALRVRGGVAGPGMGQGPRPELVDT